MNFLQLRAKKKNARLVSDVMVNQPDDRLCVVTQRTMREKVYVDGRILKPAIQTSLLKNSVDYKSIKHRKCVPYLLMMRDVEATQHYPVLCLQLVS